MKTMKNTNEGKIFIFLLIILVALAGALFWYFQRNTYSKEALILEVLVPEEAKTGEEVKFTVRYKNQGNIRLEDVNLVFNYPEGALPLDDNEKRITKDLSDIYPGEEQALEYRARLFGKKEDILTGRATLTYRPKNIKAIYESESTGSVKITDTPIAFVFDAPSKIPPRKKTEFSLNYYSNLDLPLSNVGIMVDYPAGFEFLESRPEGIENNEWKLGLLNKGEGGKIQISGKLNREGGEEGVFSAKIGIWIEDDFVVLKEESRGVEVARSSIIVSQEINGFTDYTASPGELLHYELFFRNIGDSFFENLFLISELSGPLEYKTLKTQDGKVNSEKSIVWDWHNVPELRYLGPGEEGKVDFWVSLESRWDSDSARYPMVSNRVSIREVEENFETKVSTRLALDQTAYFEDEVFGNSGPIPPEVGEETTYTITWQIENLYNDVKNAKVRASLPEGVELTGEVHPEEEEEDFTFDSESREILWDVGDIKGRSSLKSISFQVVLEPDEDQAGLVVPLVEEVKVTAEDEWTEKEVSAIDSAVDTSLPDDDAVEAEDGIVED